MRNKEIMTSLCQTQGSLFQLSGTLGYSSHAFIKAFMTSPIAKALDSDFDFLQWAGKEYILEKMSEELPEAFCREGEIYDGDTLYWIGYLYRYWNHYTGESSKVIYKTADDKLMNTLFLGYHTLDNRMAIDRIKEKR